MFKAFYAVFPPNESPQGGKQKTLKSLKNNSYNYNFKYKRITLGGGPASAICGMPYET